MKDIKERFENNYLLGCIKLDGEYNIYLMPIAWWILNYSKYDPKYDPKQWSDKFRDNILNVSEDEIDNFIKSIDEDKIEKHELGLLMRIVPVKYSVLHFFIDFDSKMFINGYYDNIEIEEYLPDSTWKGKLDDPQKYIPDNLRKLIYE